MSNIFGEHFQSILDRGVELPNLCAAWDESNTRREKLIAHIGDRTLSHTDVAIVVFGSLARRECTAGSDLDWALLIDGPVDSQHLQTQLALAGRIAEPASGFKPPGRTATFGELMFSHSLVHDVGGELDTNQNMTRRLLMLLESDALPIAEGETVFERVVKAILNRYVLEDASYLNREEPVSIPRYLLNDVVRFWRTMAVDYAHKFRQRGAKGWALRNIKLRMSRKLLFVAGLEMCLSWEWAAQSSTGAGFDAAKKALVSHLASRVKWSPLESLAALVEHFAPFLAEPIFSAYDNFVGLLRDDGKRKALEKLAPDKAFGDVAFLEARANAEIFDEALQQLFFDSSTNAETLKKLVRKYGVF